MDIKLYTETLLKKIRSVKKHAYYVRLIFLSQYEVKSLKAF